MPRKRSIPHRNRSPYGWWLFREVQQRVSFRQKKLTERSRCLVWENTRIIKAANRDQAYKKAMRLGREYAGSKTNGGEWRFAGISLLIPSYDEIEDGAEILWNDLGRIPVSRIRRRVKSRKRLNVFDDSERGT